MTSESSAYGMASVKKENVEHTITNNGIHHLLYVAGCDIEFDITIKGMNVPENTDRTISYNVIISMPNALTLLDILGYKKDEINALAYNKVKHERVENDNSNTEEDYRNDTGIKNTERKARRKYKKKAPTTVNPKGKRVNYKKKTKKVKQKPAISKRTSFSNQIPVNICKINTKPPTVNFNNDLDICKVELSDHSDDYNMDVSTDEETQVMSGHFTSSPEPHAGERRKPSSRKQTHIQPRRKRTAKDTVREQNEIVVCSVCGKEFKSKNLNSHMKRCHEEKQFKCSKCPLKFAYKNRYEEHMRYHNGIKRYMCSVCGRRFSTNTNLRYHNLQHTGEKPHACTYCDYRCKFRPHMVIHIRKHTGERPYPCDQCPYRSAARTRLATHKKTHNVNQERPHVCTQCEMSFPRAYRLYRHLKTHTDIKPFECALCSYTARRADTLKTHMKTHRSDHRMPQLY